MSDRPSPDRPGAERRIPQHPGAERRVPERLALATILASGTVLIASIAWLVGRSALEGPTLPDAAGLLVAVGFLCLAGLLLRRSTAGAWFALTAAAITATREPAALQAQLRLIAADEAWLTAAAISAVTAVAATAVAALYAARPDRRPHRVVGPLAWALVGWLAIAVVLALALSAAGFDERSRIPGSAILFLPARQWAVVVLGLTSVGVLGDVLPAARRTRSRSGTGTGRSEPTAWLAVFLDELTGRADARRAAVESERRRLAGDLHAEALPGLRAALVDLEAGRPADEVAARLRDIATELETVVVDRRDPILESLGLVPALEALAERVEGRSGVAVELAIPDGLPPGRPPATVEAAVHRVAALALDNAVRHAGAGRVEVRVAAAATAVDLTVADDGRGIEDGSEARALRNGRRGLAEIRRIAADLGGSAAIGPGRDGGTVVRFRWPADP